MLNFYYCKLSLFLVLAITLLNGSWGYPKEVNILSGLNVAEIELAYHTSGIVRYQQILGNRRETFVEVSGVLDEDDPLKEFTAYLTDPVNWDPTTQFIDRRFIYEANIELQQRGNLLGRNSTIRIGLETHAEEALVHYVSPTNIRSLRATSSLNLIDIRYAPYLTLQSTPLDWITVEGDARFNFLHFDAQNVCRTTCPLQPNSTEDNVIPSLHGNLTIRPWQGTEMFMNIGTGYHSFQDREPIGSTAVEQLTQATSYELGMRIQPRVGIEVSASFWQVDLGSDRVFLEDGDDVLLTQSSMRRGLNFRTSLSMLERLSMSGSLTFSQTAFRKTGEKIPLSPTFTAEASVNGQWGDGWSNTFHMRHIGQRTDSENPDTTLQPFTTFDFTTNYRLDNPSTRSNLEITFGVLNLTNTTGPYTQFFFDSQRGAEYAQVFNLNYFPGQPRTVVGGITWKF